MCPIAITSSPCSCRQVVGRLGRSVLAVVFALMVESGVGVRWSDCSRWIGRVLWRYPSQWPGRQDSLGGSAKTLMFVNCSPASSNAEDSSHVIYVAFRAEVGELVDVVTESTTCVVHMLRPLRRNGSYKPPFEKGVF